MIIMIIMMERRQMVLHVRNKVKISTEKCCAVVSEATFLRSACRLYYLPAPPPQHRFSRGLRRGAEDSFVTLYTFALSHSILLLFSLPLSRQREIFLEKIGFSFQGYVPLLSFALAIEFKQRGYTTLILLPLISHIISQISGIITHFLRN